MFSEEQRLIKNFLPYLEDKNFKSQNNSLNIERIDFFNIVWIKLKNLIGSLKLSEKYIPLKDLEYNLEIIVTGKNQFNCLNETFFDLVDFIINTFSQQNNFTEN